MLKEQNVLVFTISFYVWKISENLFSIYSAFHVFFLLVNAKYLQKYI